MLYNGYRKRQKEYGRFRGFCIVTAMSLWVQSLDLFLVAEQFSVFVAEQEPSTRSLNTEAVHLC